MPQSLETERILIVARTYPTPSMRGVEVSCTAGVTHDGRWIRLFPVPYRFLNPDQRFSKYNWIIAKVSRGSDQRLESRKLKIDSVTRVGEPVSSDNGWKARKELVFPLKSKSLCELTRQRDRHQYPTLGFFKPEKVKRLLLEPDNPNWTQAQLETLGQGLLFDRRMPADLEKVPFRARYEFTCADAGCQGHTLMWTDWEMGEAWRRWKTRYGDDGWEDKFRQSLPTR